MKKKVRFRQFLSGVMAVMTILSTTLSPLSAYAAEPEKKETSSSLTTQQKLLIPLHRRN